MLLARRLFWERWTLSEAEKVLAELHCKGGLKQRAVEGHRGREVFEMKQFILVLALLTMQYTVNPSDTLQSIAELYCQGDDPRQVAEFREGIRELNYDVIGESDVWAGLVLEINRWE